MTANDPLVEFRRKYPEFAWLTGIQDPAIQQLLKDAAAKPGGMDAAEFQGRLFATPWWQTTPPSRRQWIYEANADPASAQAKRARTITLVTDMATTMGFDNGPWIGALAEQALENGWDDAQIRDQLANRMGQYASGQVMFGTTGASMDAIKALGSKYLIGVSQQDAWNWTREIMAGSQTMEGVESILTQQARNLYPHLSAQLNDGTFSQVVATYQNQIAQLLEKNPADVFLADPKYQKVLDFVDDSGNRRMMTNYELGQYVRSMPEWRYTTSAREQSAELGQKLLETLGKTA